MKVPSINCRIVPLTSPTFPALNPLSNCLLTIIQRQPLMLITVFVYIYYSATLRVLIIPLKLHGEESKTMHL